jgi:nucleotide-binding universal stress UspA family protein
MNDISNIGHVVIATDLSERSRYALERASRLVAAGAGPCTAVLVVNGGALDSLCRLMGEDTAAFQSHLMQDSKAKLEQLVDEIFGSLAARGETPHDTSLGLFAQGFVAETSSTPGTGAFRLRALDENPGARSRDGFHHGLLAIDTRVVVGNVVSTLLAQADELDAGLIVLGARGGGFLRQLVLGTTAERILRKTARPVLVVRQAPVADYRRVVVAVDFSAASATALRLALALAPNAELVLVHAYEVPFESKLRFAGVDEPMIERYRERAEDEATKGLEAFITEVGLPPGRARLVVEQGDPTRVILDQQGCDLVVVGQRGKGALEELLLGSVTKHVLAETNIDVLVAVPTKD